MSTPHYPNGPRRRPSPGSSSMRNVQLPAFCRTRSPRSQLVSVNNLRNLQRLLLLVLLFQLTTLLLWHYRRLSFPHWPQLLQFSWHQPFVLRLRLEAAVEVVQTLRSWCWL